jgi:hypothetical protein
MLADDRSEVSLKRHTHAIAAMDMDEPANVEVDLSVAPSLIDLVNPKASRAQCDDGVSERRAH